MEAAFHEANVFYINEEYEKAIPLYTSAIGLHPDNGHLQSLQNRAAAYLKLHRYYESLDDLNSVLAIDASIELAHYRKGIAFFELEEFESAKASFQKAVEIRQSSGSNADLSAYLRYIRKSPVPAPAPPQVPSTSTSTSSLPATSTSTSVPPSSAAASTSTSTLSCVSSAPIRYQYYQSATTLNISIASEVWPSLDYTGGPRVRATAPKTADSVAPVGSGSSRPKAYASSRDWDKVSTEISQGCGPGDEDGNEEIFPDLRWHGAIHQLEGIFPQAGHVRFPAVVVVALTASAHTSTFINLLAQNSSNRGWGWLAPIK
eukprot:gene33383-43159_t